MKFSFKSSGKKINNQDFKLKNQQIDARLIPIGIKTPVRFGQKKSKLFEMNEDPIEQIKDNLKNLIQTNQGERLGRFTFGCNLRSLLFERVGLDEDFNRVATEHIQKQVNLYIPAIQIDNIEYSVFKKDKYDNRTIAEIIISILFSIPQARIGNKRIDIKLACGG